MLEAERLKILVVDDEAQIARLLKTTLSARGYLIRTAVDGDDALLIMRGWTPDLVITDLRMPNVDGVELCRTIRRNLQFQSSYSPCGMKNGTR